MPLGLSISCKACLLFNIFSGDLHVDAFVIELCQICQSDYWQKQNLKGVRWRVNGDLGSYFGLGASEQTRSGRKLCILFCHGFGTWRNKEVGGLKYERDGASHKEMDNFYRGVDPLTSLSELPTYFSLFWCKKIFMICLT